MRVDARRWTAAALGTWAFVGVGPVAADPPAPTVAEAPSVPATLVPHETSEVDPFLRRPVPTSSGAATAPGRAYYEVEVRHLVFAPEVAARWFGSETALGAVPASDADVRLLLEGISRGPGPSMTGAARVTVDAGKPVWSRVATELDPSVPAPDGLDVGTEPVGDHVGVLVFDAAGGRLGLDLDLRCASVVAAGPAPSAPCAPGVVAETYVTRAAHLATDVADGGAVLVGPLGTTAKGGVRAALVQARRASPPTAPPVAAPKAPAPGAPPAAAPPAAPPVVAPK